MKYKILIATCLIISSTAFAADQSPYIKRIMPRTERKVTEVTPAILKWHFDIPEEDCDLTSRSSKDRALILTINSSNSVKLKFENTPNYASWESIAVILPYQDMKALLEDMLKELEKNQPTPLTTSD